MVGITLALITIGFSGCTQQNSSNESNPTPQTTESIETILSKAETIKSLYYEIVSLINNSKSGTQTNTIKIWQKTPYLKEEITNVIDDITKTISIIKRPEGTYLYNTRQGKYLPTTNLTIPQQPNNEIIKDLLNNQTLTNLGNETIDGKKATIIQYTSMPAEFPTTIKMWVWNEKGVLLKVQSIVAYGNSTITMESTYKNYSFSDIPDSTFSVS